MTSHLDTVRAVLAATLQLGDKAAEMDLDTPLLGSIAELDSMAVVTVLTSIEEQYGFIIDDDEVSASIFESVGTLVEFVSSKCE